MIIVTVCDRLMTRTEPAFRAIFLKDIKKPEPYVERGDERECEGTKKWVKKFTVEKRKLFSERCDLFSIINRPYAVREYGYAWAMVIVGRLVCE